MGCKEAIRMRTMVCWYTTKRRWNGEESTDHSLVECELSLNNASMPNAKHQTALQTTQKDNNSVNKMEGRETGRKRTIASIEQPCEQHKKISILWRKEHRETGRMRMRANTARQEAKQKVAYDRKVVECELLRNNWRWRAGIVLWPMISMTIQWTRWNAEKEESSVGKMNGAVATNVIVRCHVLWWHNQKI